MGGRVGESSAPHGAEVDRGNREVNGGGRPEGAGGRVNTEQLREDPELRVKPGCRVGEGDRTRFNRGKGIEYGVENVIEGSY
ncbi:hypothetical protein ATANTOWER_012447 [Ataeniobius toweri]|uniref:Uncharacterized protein n=1 Tax=Ataeniobius toweri TaxID=208326 RepID=A0ABU7BU79_9TELE|nr:hypothetical protein [Ataeniobius toweri]